MLNTTLDVVGTIISDRKRQAEQARRARQSEQNNVLDLGLTAEDVMADLDPGWLTRRISQLHGNTDQSAGIPCAEGVLS